MQDPVYEVASVIKGTLQARSATKQSETFRRFYAPDASYDHPFYSVNSGQNSRDAGILPIHQFRRCLFTPFVEVHNVAFDKESNKLFLDVTKRLRSLFLPASLFSPTLRMVTVLFLQRGADGKFYIKRQEDYYQPQVLVGKFFPGAETAIVLAKRIAAVFCLLFALMCRIIFRHWRPLAATGDGG